VSLEQYVAGLQAQTEQSATVRRRRLQQALSHLVLRADVLRQVGPAFESGRALFLYGSPGNGKTVLASALGSACGDPMLIPYAIAVDGQVIRLLDPIVHGVTVSGEGTEQGGARKAASLDQRWVKVKRPMVFAGGELDLSMLELTFNEREGHHEAPLHLKASGGVLVIDDFGRQSARPRDLLNRWIVPLDKGIDYLTLRTGKKFPVPFASMVIFATNLDPHDLVDEAFLRRIPYKVELPSPDHDEYCEIFVRACGELGLEPNLTAIDHIYHRFYVELGMEPRSCHPRDILQKLIELAKWENVPPQISPANLDHVCRSYFLED
jgi:predicted ATPase with chaperone activity